MVIPPGYAGVDNTRPIHVVQVDYTVGCCPKDFYAVHFTTLESANGRSASAVLDKALQILLDMCHDKGAVEVFWRTQFKRHPSCGGDSSDGSYVVAPGLPALRAGISHAFVAAEALLQKLFPEYEGARCCFQRKRIQSRFLRERRPTR